MQWAAIPQVLNKSIDIFCKPFRDRSRISVKWFSSVFICLGEGGGLLANLLVLSKIKEKRLYQKKKHINDPRSLRIKATFSCEVIHASCCRV